MFIFQKLLSQVGHIQHNLLNYVVLVSYLFYIKRRTLTLFIHHEIHKKKGVGIFSEQFPEHDISRPFNQPINHLKRHRRHWTSRLPGARLNVI